MNEPKLFETEEKGTFTLPFSGPPELLARIKELAERVQDDSAFHGMFLKDGGFKRYKDAASSLWMMERKDERPLKSRGRNIPNVQRVLFERFTLPGDLVLDLFLGSGTSVMVGNEMGRYVMGVDISLDDYDLELRLKPYTFALEANSAKPYFCFHLGDEIKKRFDREAADFVFLHPPYYDIIKYGHGPDDLSEQATIEDFIRMFGDVAYNAYGALRDRGWCALLVGDVYRNGRYVPLSHYLFEQMTSNGFLPKGEVIKNITGNEAKGRDRPLWEYRSLKNGTFVFDHEKIFLFRKGFR